MTVQALTQSDMDQLSIYSTSGQFLNYYGLLESKGYDYAKLAKGVALGEGHSGAGARQFAENVGKITGEKAFISPTEWQEISLDLMQQDFAARNALFPTNNTPDIGLGPIRDYHTDVFRSHGLPPEAWTAFIPTSFSGMTTTQQDTQWSLMLGAADGSATEWVAGFLGAGMPIAHALVDPFDTDVDDNNAALWIKAMLYGPDGEFAGTDSAFQTFINGQADIQPYSIVLSNGNHLTGGSQSAEVISAGSNNDGVMIGYAGDDTLYGSNGDDTIFGNDGTDEFHGRAGNDILIGGNDKYSDATASYDIASYRQSTSGIEVDMNLSSGQVIDDGEGGTDTLYGIRGIEATDHNDMVIMSSSAALLDILNGGQGDDRLDGGAGNDSLYGDDDYDTLRGGEGNDRLFGGAGYDTLSGGDGNDVLYGFYQLPTELLDTEWREGGSRLYGGAGNDSLHSSSSTNALIGGTGDDEYYFDGRFGENEVVDDGGEIYINGELIEGMAESFIEEDGPNPEIPDPDHLYVRYTLQTENSEYTLHYFTSTQLILDDGEGNYIKFSWSQGKYGIYLDWLFEEWTEGPFETEPYEPGPFNSESYYGTHLPNVFSSSYSEAADTEFDESASNPSLENNTGTSGADTIVTNRGPGTVTAAAGNDTITSYGPKAIYGGDGSDRIVVEDKSNVIFGDAGADTIIVRASQGSSIEGGAGADTITGGSGEDTISYSASSAAVSVNLGTGSVSGGDAAGDSISSIEDITGSAYADSIIGSGGVNILSGLASNDTIRGGDGADLIDGGDGNDSVYGDAGVTTTDPDGNDTIYGGLGADWISSRHGDDSVQGGDGNDSLYGDTSTDTLGGNDTLDGGADSDQILGLYGNDLLIGGAGADTLDGGQGTDTASYESSTAGVVINLFAGTVSGGDAAGDSITSIENLIGSAYADTLLGGTNANSLVGGAGNDSVYGGSGNDTLNGSEGADTITGWNDNDLMIGGAGADTLDGGSGEDTVSYATSALGVIVNLTTPTASGGDATGDTFTAVEHLIGSAYSDILTGTSSANKLDGADGNDTLSGGAGADSLTGGNGTDTASYATSGSAIVVNLSTGSVSGGDAASDVLTSIENLIGSAYADSLTGSTDANSLDAGDGNDTLSGGDGNDTLLGGNGADSISGGNNNDLLVGGAGSDTLDGGAGEDTVSYIASSAAVTVNLGTNSASGGDAAIDTFTTIEHVIGSIYNDNITGSTAANSLEGNAGNDTLAGSDGNDTITGGSGTDSISGGNNDDLLIGGSSGDTLDGGSGNDTASYSGSGAAVTVDLSLGTSSGGDAAGDTFTSVEHLIGSSFGDSLTGSSSANNLAGGNGNDTLIGGAGSDTLDGGVGSDTISYAASSTAVTVNLSTNSVSGGDAAGDTITSFEHLIGSAGNDSLTGSADANNLDSGLGNDTVSAGVGQDTISAGDGHDSVLGGDDNDVIYGSAGRDTLKGEAGNDTIEAGSWVDGLYGGTEADTFRFLAIGDSGIGSGNRDIIYDFSHTEGDKIDLSAFTGTFRFLTYSSSYTSADSTPEILMTTSGSDTVITIDRDGNNTTDLELQVNGVTSLVSGDFIL